MFPDSTLRFAELSRQGSGEKPGEEAPTETPPASMTQLGTA